MATIKSFTDLSQSKKLAEILPIESADYYHATDAGIVITAPYITYCGKERCVPAYKGAVPCWSLAALLGVLPNYFYDKTGRKTLGMDKGDTYYNIFYENMNSYIKKSADNPVDACVAMIEKLHELKML